MTVVPVKDFWLNKTTNILTQLPARLFGFLMPRGCQKSFLLEKTSREFHWGHFLRIKPTSVRYLGQRRSAQK